jgi:hypothetical protein
MCAIKLEMAPLKLFAKGLLAITITLVKRDGLEEAVGFGKLLVNYP